MRLKALVCAVALFAGGAAALAQEGDAEVAPSAPTAPALPPMSVVTYNLGLAHGAVALADERMPAQIEAVSALNADVVCLQEVWTDADNTAFLDAVKASYPYSMREVIEDDSDASTPCGVCKTLRMKHCAEKKCLDKGISVFECVDTGPCVDRYNALTDDCKRCLAANVDAASSCALGGAQELGNDGRNGILLLSKHPIENARYVPFDAFLLSRGMLVADINGYRVGCTHLSADLGMLPYPQDAAVKSWAEEHEAEIRKVSEELGGGQCTIFTGDLNTGPDGQDIGSELPDSWALLGQEGFDEPIPAPLCTFCMDNVLAGTPKNLNLDHVTFRGCPDGLKVSYERMFDQPIRVEGHPDETRLSDHYGVKATLSW